MNKEELFKQRESLVDKLNLKEKELESFQNEFEKKVEPTMNSLSSLQEEIIKVRSDLYKLGVDVTDC